MGDALAHMPDAGDGGAGDGRPAEGVDHVKLVAHHQRRFRRWFPLRQGAGGRAGLVINSRELAFTRRPVDLETHAIVVKSISIRGIEKSTPPIDGGTLEVLDQISLQTPDADPFGLKVFFGDPQGFLSILFHDGESSGGVHLLGIVGPIMGGVFPADGTQVTSVRVEYKDLVVLSVIADVDQPLMVEDDGLGGLQPGCDQKVAGCGVGFSVGKK